MNWQYNAWTLLLFTGAAIALALAVLGWRRRAAPGARPFSLFMLLAAWHALAYALEIGGLNLEFIIFWGKVEYVAICFEPVAWLAFALEYSGLQKWLTRRNLLFLSLVPTLVLIASWTNELHGWVKRNFALDRSAGFSNATFTPGPVYWVNVFYVYGVFALTLLLLLRAFMCAPRPYRAQAGAILIGNFVPLLGGLMYLTDLTPWPGLDLSILMFPLVGAIIMWGVFRFRLLDIVPVAREMVVENMDDVVIVLDNQNRVVDLNPAGERLIGRQASKAIGQPAGHVFSAWSNLVEACCRAETTHAEIIVGGNATQRHFDLRVSPLNDQGGRSIGRVIALHDITEIKQAEEERERL